MLCAMMQNGWVASRYTTTMPDAKKLYLNTVQTFLDEIYYSIAIIGIHINILFNTNKVTFS